MAEKPLFKFISYDTTHYPFAELIAKDVLHVGDLTRYHESFLQRQMGLGHRPVIRHEDNMAARGLLKTMDKGSEFYRLYEIFLQDVLAPLFPGGVYFIIPVFRVQMAHSTSISAWHRDVDVTGRSDLITAWIPFMDVSDSNTLWVETEYGKQDYVPVPVRYGQIFIFDSAWLRHGSVPNETEATRVSMDVRMIPRNLNVEGADLGIFTPRPTWCNDENAAASKLAAKPGF
jgi:hypothetical protein